MLIKVSPRPANIPCSCVWPQEHFRQQERAKQEDRIETVTSPLSTLATLPETLSTALPAFASSEKKVHDFSPGTSDGTTLGESGASPTGYGSVRPLQPHEQAKIEREKVARDDALRLDKKRGTLGKSSMAASKKPDVLIRQIKKRVARSSEFRHILVFSSLPTAPILTMLPSFHS